MSNEKDKLIGLISFGLLITVIGFILLFFSVNLGFSLAENWILNRGGGADTSKYLIVIEGSIYK
ncbi:hypothetical protein MKZ01_14050 [Lysinibacillus endophyticus]|uniref:hypothetical protein n=1 Tax=Ureibacillus endophyticus TaxID=1978490 RepID=UPI0031368B69